MVFFGRTASRGRCRGRCLCSRTLRIFHTKVLRIPTIPNRSTSDHNVQTKAKTVTSTSHVEALCPFARSVTISELNEGRMEIWCERDEKMRVSGKDCILKLFGCLTLPKEANQFKSLRPFIRTRKKRTPASRHGILFPSQKISHFQDIAMRNILPFGRLSCTWSPGHGQLLPHITFCNSAESLSFLNSPLGLPFELYGDSLITEYIVLLIFGHRGMWQGGFVISATAAHCQCMCHVSL